MAQDVERSAAPADMAAPFAILRRSWWLVLLQGIAAVIFGILAFVWPGATLLTLIIFYGAFAFADGILALAAAITGRGGSIPVWWLVLTGILGIAAGAVTFFWPGITAVVLVMVIGAWAVVRGAFAIAGAIHLRKEIDNEWWLILSGALSILFGAAMLIMPGAGALALVWVIGIYAVAFGILEIMLAFRLKPS